MRGVKVLDDATRGKVAAALLRASESGQDPVEYLHRYGLIATPAMKNKIRADTVDSVANATLRAAMESLSGDQLLAVVITVEKLRQLSALIREGKWKG